LSIAASRTWRHRPGDGFCRRHTTRIPNGDGIHRLTSEIALLLNPLLMSPECQTASLFNFRALTVSKVSMGGAEQVQFRVIVSTRACLHNSGQIQRYYISHSGS